MTAKSESSSTSARRTRHQAVPRRAGKTPDALHNAFLTRATKALDQMAQRLDSAALERAVAAPTDAGALARAVSEAAAYGEAEGTLDPLAELIARGGEQKMELLKNAGGTLSVSEVARVLGLTRQAVDKRRQSKQLVAVRRGAEYAFPACQFDEDGVVPELPSLLKLLDDQGWVALAFLVTEFDELSGLTPLEVLRRKDRTLEAPMERLARIASGDDVG
jgi:hypothetical protein